MSHNTAPAKLTERDYADMRSHERVPVEVAVSMESENNFYAGITDNISEGGVFIATVTPPARGTVVDLQLSLPGYEAPFAVRGVVRWIREPQASCEGMPPGCGIQWLEMTRETLMAIHHFVQRRETILFDV
jgi:uncharacterized protein (TIGR02266 family)